MLPDLGEAARSDASGASKPTGPYFVFQPSIEFSTLAPKAVAGKDGQEAPNQRQALPGTHAAYSAAMPGEEVRTSRIASRIQFYGNNNTRPVFPTLEEAFQFDLSWAERNSESAKAIRHEFSRAIDAANAGRNDESSQLLTQLMQRIPESDVGLTFYSRLLLSYLQGTAFDLPGKDRIVIAFYRRSPDRAVLAYMNEKTQQSVGLSDIFVDNIKDFTIRTHSNGYVYIESPEISPGCGAVFLYHLGSRWHHVLDCPN